MIDSDSDSDTPRSAWDFRSVRRFRRAFNAKYDVDNTRYNAIPNISTFKPQADVPKSLGDFDRLLGFCGKAVPIPIPIPSQNAQHEETDSSSLRSDRSTPPTSAPEDDPIGAEHFDDFVSRTSGKTVQWKDEVGHKEIAESQRKSARDAAAHLDPATVEQLLEESDTSSDAEGQGTPTPTSNRKLKKRAHNILDSALDTPTSLVPASVTVSNRLSDYKSRPPPPLLQHFYDDPYEIHALYTLTNNEQKAKLIKRMTKELGSTTKEQYGQAIHRLGELADAGGIHVFVDMSNIAIGFQDQMKTSRGIPKICRVRNPPMSFASLALIMERGRKVARRVLAGSTHNFANSESTKLHKHIQEAGKYGYELNILERVSKPVTPITKKKARHGTGSGYATSGNSSASESGMARQHKMQEQAVDELLQMKMLESIVDVEKPTTIVLASGDAAEAEFSGGFLKNVERALSKGWKVEVVAWRKGLSYEYRSQKLLKKWQGQLRIIELDPFCEELLAVYVPKYHQQLHTLPNGVDIVGLFPSYETSYEKV